MFFKKHETQKYYESLNGMLDRFGRYAGRDRFTGDTLEELKAWQERERKSLSGITGLDRLFGIGSGSDEYCDIWTETSRESISDGITRIRTVFRVDEYTYMPMIVLEPEAESKGTCLCPAGHQGGGKESVAGVRDRRSVSDKIDFFNYDYGLKLAKMGYTAICPDQRGFGERREAADQGDSDDKLLSCSCRNIANMAIPMGLSVIGLCTYDYIRLIDYLEKSGRYDVSGLGCVGFSGGGMQALYLAALDLRVSKVFISGYMYGVRDSLMILNNNCSCNYVPGLWEHLDMGDIAMLIAPRPLLIQSCSEDHLNGPRGLENVYEQIAIIKKAYTLFGAEDALTHDIRPGGHHFHDEPLETWAR